MPLPDFDSYGNLPAGEISSEGSHERMLLHASLHECHERFVSGVSGSSTRAAIWACWMEWRRAFEACGLQYLTLIGGSFVTAKCDPSDIDFCILLDAQEVNAVIDPARVDELNRLLNRATWKGQHRCDLYWVINYHVGEPLFRVTLQGISYWTRVFGLDRNHRSKAFLLVDERGAL